MPLPIDLRYAIDAITFKSVSVGEMRKLFETEVGETVHWTFDDTIWWDDFPSAVRRGERLGVAL